MYKKFSYIIVSILLAGISYAEITVEIFLDKYEFLEGEPIFYHVKFINNSNSIDSIIYFAIEDEFNNLRITPPDNRKIFREIMSSSFLGGVPYRKFKPYETKERINNLIEFQGDKDLRQGVLGLKQYLSEGKYKLRYEYQNRYISNEVVLNIIRPQGRDYEAFEKLLRAYQINDGHPWTMDSILLKKNTYYDIVLNHHESIYWEEAVYRYNEECNYLKLDYTDIYVNKEFVKRFPNSYFIRHIVINLCQAMYLYDGGEPSVTAYLEYLIENYQNYAVSVHAKEQFIKKEYLN